MEKQNITCPLSKRTFNLSKLLKIAKFKLNIAENWLAPLLDVVIRIYMAGVFWRSGQVKISSWDSTLMLFEYEYNVPLLPPEVAAYMATAAELALPVLLVVGLAARFGATGLLIMSAVIEIFVYPGTTEHYYWMMLLGVIMLRGPGKLSVDHLVRRRFLG